MRAIDGEVSAGGNALALLTELIEQTGGDLLVLRPDTWAMPRESAMSKVVGRAVASGRRSRAVYPLRALHEAPEVLQARVEEGEEVRLIDDAADAAAGHQRDARDRPRAARLRRLAAAAGAAGGRWSPRSPSCSSSTGSAACRSPRCRAPAATSARSSCASSRSGAKDEQIARTMGLSLRTVRRRVADLMIELGVDTRFQAGAEAVRRGWL